MFYFTKTNFIFTKTFRCGSNKCLCGEAGTAALIDAFGIGTGNSMPCRGTILGKTCFLFCLIIA